MKCADCDSGEGGIGNCPYAEDVNNEIIQVVLCQDCYEERALDI